MKVDFSDCEYLETYLKFYTFKDFYENRMIIKKRYEKLAYSAKKFYSWYVYAKNVMDTRYKNAVWDYLNDEETEEHMKKLYENYRPIKGR